MPYSRRRRNTYRKRPAKKRPTYVRKVARQEARRAVRSTVETKFFDTSQSSQAVDNLNGYVVSLTNGITQGASELQYIGDRINPMGISIRAQFTRADSTQLFRFIIIQNRGGGIPLITTLLANAGNLTTPLSAYDRDYNDTYRILYDTTISMDSIRCTTTQRVFKIPGRKLRLLRFNNNSGQIESGGIYICVVSDSGSVSHPVFDYRARFYFKDA